MGQGSEKVTDVITKIEEGCQTSVEAISRLIGLLPRSHFIGDEKASEVNGDHPMFADCQIV